MRGRAHQAKLRDALDAVKLHKERVHDEEERRRHDEKMKVMQSLQQSGAVKQALDDHKRQPSCDGWHLEKRGGGFDYYEMERGQKVFSNKFATEKDLLEFWAGQTMGESKPGKKKKKK